MVPASRPEDHPADAPLEGRTRAPAERISRRRFLAGASIAAAGVVAPQSLLAAALGPARTEGTPYPRITTALAAPRHLVWVWQFRHDGDPELVRDQLAAHGLGIILKTHDGTSWMSRYDPTPNAIDGPQTVEQLARFFEDGGVPFHAWGLVKGRNPAREAEMAAEVLSAGARSFFVDLEAHPGFWEGTPGDAMLFGEALRQRQPSARVSTSIDARPWEIERVPLAEFSSFTDEIAPQFYWGAFANRANARRYVAGGHQITSEEITPGFVVDTSMARLRDFGLPIHPIGDGTVPDVEPWGAFIDSAYTTAEADTVSVWRFGVTSNEVLALLRDTPPRISAYVVEPGDTLGAIAARFGTSVDALATTNGITNPNLIQIGQRLVIP